MLKYRLKLKLAVRIIYKNVPVSIQISIQIYGQKHAHEYKPHGWTEQQAVIWRKFEENMPSSWTLVFQNSNNSVKDI